MLNEQSMKQHRFGKNTLTLNVKRAPLIIRAAMFIFAFLCVAMPLLGMTLYALLGYGIHIGFLFGIVIFGLLGFYLLRVGLWNTYGNEVIAFSKTEINYIADYGWFKDGKKHLGLTSPALYTLRQIGYEEDNVGALIIEAGEERIFCVTKMPIAELEELIEKLNNSTHI